MSNGTVPSILRRTPARSGAPGPQPNAASPPTDATNAPEQAFPAGNADHIDYQIVGNEMQFIELELDPSESAIAEAGALMFKAPQITMDTVLGDGSQRDQGFFGKIASAGRRVLTGENLFMTLFTNEGQGKARIAFAAPYPGTILPFHLAQMGGTLIAQKDSFLCAARGVSVGIHFQRKIGTGLFGGNGFIMQRLEGDGWAFVHGGGTIIERDLAPGEDLHVDTGCVVAMTPDVTFDIVRAGSIKSMFFGGEGFFFANLTGPGRVWLQSLPFSRLAGQINALGGVRGAAGGSSLSSNWGFGGSSSDGGGDGGGD